MAPSGEENDEETRGNEETSGSEYEDNGSSSGSEDDEASVGESDVDEADEEEATGSDSSEGEEWNPREPDLREKVTAIINGDPCESKCLRGRAAAIESVVTSVRAMTSDQKKESVLTALAVLMHAPAAAPKRVRSGGERRRFQYHLPYVGPVCQGAFALCYSISVPTISRYRKAIENGSFAVKPHGNRNNAHAQRIDFRWIEAWFEHLAKCVGEVVPVSIRRRKKEDGKIILFSVAIKVTLLPSNFTWERIYDELKTYAEDEDLEEQLPAFSTFRAKMKRKFPDIRIRSPRSNVCDICFIYHTEMAKDGDPDVAEKFGQHTQEARVMREEYKNDIESASDKYWVLTMDYAQNYNVPNVPETPSQWYFMSLLNVSVFGVHLGHSSKQTNFVYSEFTGGKGPNEVISLLNRVVCAADQDPDPARTLTIYADNCSGQNKNNFVLKFCLALVHTRKFKEINVKFLVKGHTKNACDRGFGHLRRHLVKQSCWTVPQLVEAMNGASKASEAILIDSASPPTFFDYKTALNELYRNLKGIKKYQLFRMRSSRPGIIECRPKPTAVQEEWDLRKKFSGEPVCARAVDDALMPPSLVQLEAPKKNVEKMVDTFTKIRPYVPEKWLQDSLYTEPTAEETSTAKTIKRARRELRATCNSRSGDCDILPHAGFKCPKAPEDVVESARAEIKKAEALKAKRKPSGGAATNRVEKRKREKAHDMTPFDGMSDDEEFSSTTPGAYDQKRLNVLLGRMCNSVGMPFSEVDSPAFHAMIAALNPNVQLPTSEQLKTVMPQRVRSPTKDEIEHEYWAGKVRYWRSIGEWEGDGPDLHDLPGSQGGSDEGDY